MIAGRNIICLASAWGIDPTSKHQIMRCLARRNRILWVNYHGSRVPRLSWQDVRRSARTLRAVAGGRQQAAPGITTITPLLLPFPGSAAARAINRRLVRRQIVRAMRGWEDRPVQLWSFAPDVGWLFGRFGEERAVYCCVDEFSQFEGYDRELTRRLEREVIGKSDVVITTSEKLFESKRRLHPRTFLVRHGVDADHFARALAEQTPVPAELTTLRRPVIGFFGLIHDWVDLELLDRVAALRPEWSFVLIGEIKRDVERLRRRANVHFFGRRPYEELPAFCRGFDVATIPFVVNELTLHVNPIKLREYLAAGLPVVATPLPEVRRYEPHVRPADTPEAFVAACAQAIAEDSPQKRRERAASVASESWQAGVEYLSHLNKLHERRSFA